MKDQTTDNLSIRLNSQLIPLVVFSQQIAIQWSSLISNCLISKFFQCTEQRCRDLCINKFAY